MMKATFTLEKLKALRAYFLKLRNGSRGKPEYADLDTTVAICEQLIAIMERPQSEVRA